MRSQTLRCPDGLVSGRLLDPDGVGAGLVVMIHGGGCHSAYFEMSRPSVVELALSKGLSVLLIDRPGVRGNRLADVKRPLAASVSPIRDFIRQVWRDHLPRARVGLIGHSIGGALALTIAATPRTWPLVGVAVSGIGDEPPARVKAWQPAPTDFHGLGGTQMAAYLLGPEGSYNWQSLLRLRRVAAAWNARERWEVVRCWPACWPALAPCITVPVQIRLADGEKIWETGGHVIARMAAALTASTYVDAALLQHGGHLYELHKRGPELATAQADFMNRLLVRS